MSKTVTFEIQDEIYEALQKMAVKYGRTTEEMVLEWLAKHARKPRTQLSEQEREAARARLRRHAGAASLGHPTGADNESIDADLAREYGSTHEEES
jgi:predicted transcriptional regulator